MMILQRIENKIQQTIWPLKMQIFNKLKTE